MVLILMFLHEEKGNELYSYRISLFASTWRQNSSCRVQGMPGG